MLQPFQRGKLLHNALNAPADVRPPRGFVLANDAAAQAYTPGLYRLATKAKALERDGEPDDVAIRRQASLRVPKCVEAIVFALSFGEDGVGLDTKRITKKVIGSPAVVEGVEEDADHVVAESVFALGHASADLPGLVFAHKNDIEVLVVVGEIRGRWLAHWHAVAGVTLAKAGDDGFVFARGSIQKVFEPGRPFDTGDPQDGEAFEVPYAVL